MRPICIRLSASFKRVLCETFESVKYCVPISNGLLYDVCKRFFKRCSEFLDVRKIEGEFVKRYCPENSIGINLALHMNKVGTILLLLLFGFSTQIIAQTNLALNKTANASSGTASPAFDGNTGTRWESEHGVDPQWIYVDLGQSYDIGTITLRWEGAYASHYTIDVATDTASWTTVYTETSGNGDIDNLTVSGTGRYIRMHGTTRATPYGYSLWEFEVYEAAASGKDVSFSDITVNGTTIDNFSAATKDYRVELTSTVSTVPTVAVTTTDGDASVAYTNATSVPGTTTAVITSQDGSTKDTVNVKFHYPSISLNKVAFASNENQPASYAVDGNTGTRWETAASDPQWITIDLGSVYKINEVKLSWEGAYGSAYEIQVTNDTTSWTTAFTETSGDGETDLISLNHSGRYIRMYGTTRGTTYGYSLWEFEVYGDITTEITGDAGWRLLTLPVNNALLTQFSDDTPIQGVSGGSDTGSDPNIYLYNTSGSFVAPGSVNDTLSDGSAVALYFFDNGTNGSSELPVTLDAIGAEPSSNVSVTLNPSASGYTLVGNPFATNLNTDSLSASASNISNNIALWSGGSYTTVDRTSGYIVAPWQGFWVQTTSAATSTLTIPTSGKTNSAATGTFFGKVVSNRADIQFSLTSESTVDNALKIAFRENATLENDADDFGKLVPLTPSYATMAIRSNEQLKSVESLPYRLEEAVTLPLAAEFVNASGEFTLSWSGLESVPGDWDVTFHDYETGTNIDMRAQSEIVFEAEPTTKTKGNPVTILSGPDAIVMTAENGSDRFGITITPPVINSREESSTPHTFGLSQNYPNPFNPSTTINYSIENAGFVSIDVFNVTGQKVAALVHETKNAGAYNIRWDASAMSSGIYYYRLSANGNSVTKKMTLIK